MNFKSYTLLAQTAAQSIYSSWKASVFTFFINFHKLKKIFFFSIGTQPANNPSTEASMNFVRKRKNRIRKLQTCRGIFCLKQIITKLILVRLTSSTTTFRCQAAALLRCFRSTSKPPRSRTPSRTSGRHRWMES